LLRCEKFRILERTSRCCPLLCVAARPILVLRCLHLISPFNSFVNFLNSQSTTRFWGKRDVAEKTAGRGKGEIGSDISRGEAPKSSSFETVCDFFNPLLLLSLIMLLLFKNLEKKTCTIMLLSVNWITDTRFCYRVGLGHSLSSTYRLVPICNGNLTLFCVSVTLMLKNLN
jgi:hypothetical protein